jgi:RNA polymerase sigma-70 factor (ECF subfamily)
LRQAGSATGQSLNPKPDVILRADAGVLPFARLARLARPALVNGAAGFVVAQRGRPVSVAGFTVSRGKIVEIDILADPERLRQIDFPVLND